MGQDSSPLSPKPLTREWSRLPGDVEPPAGAANPDGPQASWTERLHPPVHTAAQHPGDKPPVVLVVDDEPRLRELLTRIFTGAGYNVVPCAGGRASLAAVLEQTTFDAVVSDIRMPDMNGLGLLRAVRERDADLPVILTTGGPSVETLLTAVSRAVRLGALGRLKREAAAVIGIDPRVGDRVALEASFGRALAGIVMVCQRIARADGTVFGHEALVRTPEPGLTRPHTLMAAAERLGELSTLGRTIRTAVARLLASGRLVGPVFVNLCPSELTDQSLLDPKAPLSRFAGSVVFEITERATLDGVPDLVARISALRHLGYRIAIDDFGAGYAGLTGFTAIAPDMAKLDMALIRGIDRDPVKQRLVTSIARLCRDLGILVVAEGIETEGERESVKAAGCDLLQGFLIGRPSSLGGGTHPGRTTGSPGPSPRSLASRRRTDSATGRGAGHERR